MVEELDRPALHDRPREAFGGALPGAEDFEQVDEPDERRNRRDFEDEVLHLDQPPAAGAERPDDPDGQPDPRAGHPGRAPATSTWSRSRTRARSASGSTAILQEISPRPRAPSSSRSSRGSRSSARRWTSPRSASPRTARSPCGPGDRRDRPPGQHRAHGLRREDGHAAPRQGRHPPPPDRPGARRAAVDRT